MLSALLLAAGAGAQPQSKLTLRCTGWQPVYQAWEQAEALPERQNSELLVEVDRAARTLTTALPQSGQVVAGLEVSERYYSGTSALGRLVLNRSLDAVEFSINRLTGEGRFRYLVGETSYPAFSGICAAVTARL
jgi:hypothetical protein